MPIVEFRDLTSTTTSGESSDSIRGRVSEARKIQTDRFKNSPHTTNASMNPREMKAHCQVGTEATSYVEHAMNEMSFSARAHDRILKVSRTLADLAGAESIRSNDVLEAIQYRSMDRKLFE